MLQEAEITFVFHTAVLVDVPELLHSQAVSFRAWSSSRTTSPREKVRRLTPIARNIKVIVVCSALRAKT